MRTRYILVAIAALFTFLSCEKDIQTQELTLEETDIFLFVGQTFQLKYEVVPMKSTDKIFFESSDESIATVDRKGFVTAVGDGSVEITARCGRATASATVQVKEECILVGGQNHLEDAVINISLTSYQTGTIYLTFEKDGTKLIDWLMPESYNWTDFDLTKVDPLVGDETFDNLTYRIRGYKNGELYAIYGPDKFCSQGGGLIGFNYSSRTLTMKMDFKSADGERVSIFLNKASINLY